MGRQCGTGNDPSAAEVRAALDRLVAGGIFRRSTQLAAFLRFVVETTLRGESDRIKGYTIATEALGRGKDFDPEADPIVRVEAGRLRRALEQYYAGPGAKDKIVIDLPRGHYIPTFCRRVDRAVPVFYGIGRGSLAGILRARVLLAAAAFALIGTTVVVAIGRWERSTEQATTASVPSDRQLMSAFRAGNGFPVVSVQPFDTIGTPAVSRITPDGLRHKVRDALARFDEIAVTSAAITLTGAGDHVSLPKRPSASKYHLGATAEHGNDGTVALTFRLVDMSDNAIVWSRTFDRTQLALDPGADEDRFVQEVATTLARTFGVIHSRERGKADNDPRYACVLKMLDYLHGLDASNYAQARSCLERVTKLDPSFATGFAWLSWIYIREYQYEGFGHPGDPPALDQALKAAQRAVSLKPQSARAHEALLGAYFARGEVVAAFAAGDAALSLNPFDPAIRTVYGIRLIAVGQYDRGTALLKDTSANSVHRPSWLDSYLFLAAYLKGDLATATRYANLDTNETYPLNLLARVLSAASNGDRDQARQMIERLDKLYPAFRDHARRELGKFIPSTDIVERLTHDLAAAGLGATN
jgi:tetratricopeptide (TPR) repeat protein